MRVTHANIAWTLLLILGLALAPASALAQKSKAPSTEKVNINTGTAEQLQTLPGVRWMDSCATTDNFLVNRLSNERKTIQSLAIGTGALGELLVSGLPLLRWTTRRILKMFSADKPGDSAAKTPDPWTAQNFTEMKEAKTCKP